MIITLMGADFSKSNIGTLSSWRITRSLGAGATYEGVTSVDKDAAFSAIVTLAEGYEIGTAGISVTMGGVVLDNAYSISDNIIIITITSVTGNVLIKVPTVNTTTGEEDEPAVPDTPVIPDAPETPTTIDANGYTLTVYNNPSEITYFAGVSVLGLGGNSNDFKGYTETTGRAAAKDQAIKVSGGQVIGLNQVISGVSLTYSLFCLGADGHVAVRNDNDCVAKAWLSGNKTLPDNVAYITLAFKRGDGSVNFSAEEVALLKNAITIS